MKKLLLTILTVILFLMPAFAQEGIRVFISGSDGYRSYRIPAITRLPNGDLLAFAEGRVNGASDFGNVDIVMKKSADEGRTWSALQVVVTNDTLQAGNPAPVVDLTDPACPGGKIFLFYNTGNQPESQIRKGRGVREVWYKTSSDGGVTWSAPVNITLQVNRPYAPEADPAYTFKEDWRSYANTPGHAMQFTSGPYKGRIYVAANHSAGDPQPHFKDYRAHGFYTDDHGKTFHLSENNPFPGSNEATAAEISGGRLMMNIRNQSGDVRERIVSVSSDGGATWDTTWVDAQLPDPVCEGSILTVRHRRGNVVVVFSNNNSRSRRDSLSLRISFDNGMHWEKRLLIDSAPANAKSNGYTAYSDLVPVGRRKAGVLYEQNGYQYIVFKVLNWKKMKMLTL